MYIIAGVIGIPGNILIVHVYARKRSRNSTDILITWLALSDFTFCSIQLSFIRYMLNTCPQTTHSSCIFQVFFRYFALMFSIFLTGLIAIDRFYAVCRPLLRKITPNRARALTTLCFFGANLIALIPTSSTRIDKYMIVQKEDVMSFFKTNSSQIINMASNSSESCSFCTYGSNTWMYKTMNIIQTVVVLILFTTMGVLYFFVYRAIRKQGKVRALMEIQTGLFSSASTTLSVFVQKDHGDEQTAAMETKTQDSMVQQRDSNKAPDKTACNKQILDKTACNKQILRNQQSAILTKQIQQPQRSQRLEMQEQNHSRKNQQEQPQQLERMEQQEEQQQSHQQQQQQQQPKQKCQQDKNTVQRRTTRMLLTITLMTILTWTPSILINTVREIYPSFYTGLSYNTIVFLFSFESMYSINYCANIIIYLTMNRRFRADCLRVFRQVFKQE